MGNNTSKKIAIFASGGGSNAESIISYFEDKPEVTVSLILTNNKDAGVIQRADRHGIPHVIFSRKEFKETETIVDLLKGESIDLIVLAGFLWLIPKNLIVAFPNKILNIHPALLPKYGGKGMWGNYVHETVVANKEKESGISIHYVNEHYDEGAIIFQAKCAIRSNDTPEDVAANVLKLEHANYARIVEEVLAS